MRYIPDWVPGAGFKKTARYYAETLTRLADEPLAFTKSQMAKGNHQHSFASKLIEEDEDEEVLKWSSTGLYGAGADTV